MQDITITNTEKHANLSAHHDGCHCEIELHLHFRQIGQLYYALALKRFSNTKNRNGQPVPKIWQNEFYETRSFHKAIAPVRDVAWRSHNPTRIVLTHRPQDEMLLI